MAIQLNDRDQLIFKMIDEHQVLLEKHISWFISGEDKPVLIRDRLRKLFYLDYLLCQRHSTKLPWWTTPTKPLVYMLSPMSRKELAISNNELDLFDANVQRHLLEVANVRMLCLMTQKEGEIADFEWTTHEPSIARGRLDAVVSFTVQNEKHQIGVINHPGDKAKLMTDLETSFREGAVSMVLIVCRDEAHLSTLQDYVVGAKSQIDLGRVLFVTHHELYKSGITKACWLNAERKGTSFFGEPAAMPVFNTFGNPSVISA